MTEYTRLYDLWLASITDLSNKKKNSLLAVLTSTERIYHADAAELRATGMLRAKDIEKITGRRDLAPAEKARALMARRGIVYISREDPRYPERLRQIYDPPVGFFAMGNEALLASEATLAMVGSRNATSGAERTARDFVRAFSEAGITVVSGLADGIDAASAEGALSGIGSTIAVLGTGIDRCYPASNRALYDRVAAEGLLVSEYFLDEPPLKGHFPQRNRIISGLSDGILVVEAREKSGALITASHGLEQGKNVYAIPQDIHRRQSVGGNQLLKDGAKVVTEPGDVLEDYGPMQPAAETPSVDAEAPAAALSPEEAALYHWLQKGILTVDALVQVSGEPIQQINALLMMLELKGAVAVDYGQITLLAAP